MNESIKESDHNTHNTEFLYLRKSKAATVYLIFFWG